MLALSVMMAVSMFVGISISATAEGTTDNGTAATEVAEVRLEATTLLNMTDGNKQFKNNAVKSFNYFNGTEVVSKPCHFMKDIGGYLALMTFAEPYDASAYAEGATLKIENAALSLFMFFKTEDCLAQYQNAAYFNIDICSGEPQADGSYAYSDHYKWSVNIVKAFENCRPGWNKVIVPLATAGEKYAQMDWANIRFIRINATGVGGVPVRVGTGEYTICTSEYDELTVIDEEKNIFPVLTKNEMVGSPDVFNIVEFERDGEMVKTYIKPRTSPWWTLLNYANPIDLSHYTTTEKVFDKNIASLNTPASIEEYAAMQLYVYFADEINLEHYKLCTSMILDVCSGEPQADGSYAYSDYYKYAFNIAPLFEKCSVGWNRLIIPLCTANEKNATMDWSSVRFVRINGSGDPGGKHPGTGKGFRIGFADIGACFTTLTDMTVEGYVEPEVEEEIKNEKIYCDGGTGFHVLGFDTAFGDGLVVSDDGFYKEGEGALRLKGQGTLSTGTKLEKPLNLSMYDKISLWLYVDNTESFLAMADGQIELTSAGGRDDANEYSWALKDLDIKDGWNWVTLDLASAKKGEPDISKIDYFNVYFIGLPAICDTIFDDLHAHVSNGVVLESFDEGFMGQVQVIDGQVDKATNMSGQGWVARKKYATTFNIADCDTIGLWIKCDDETTCTSIAGTEIELSSSGEPDKCELAFFLPDNLKVGWNYVTWKISEGRPSADPIDLTAVNFIGIVKTGLPMVTCYFDDLRAYEDQFKNPEVVEPIDKQVIISADKVASGVFNGMTIDDVEYKEGFASLSTVTKDGSTKLKALFDPLKSGLSLKGEHELGYAFWFYVEDASKLTGMYVELGSYDGQPFELEWHLDLAEIQSGWNWITLKASDAARPKGVIDTNNLIRTRIVIDGSATTVKFDCFVVVDSTIDGAFDPIEDKIELNPVNSVVADNCESEWAYMNFVTETNEDNKQEGYSSVVIEANIGLATKATSIGKTDLLYNPYRSNNELGIAFWTYFEDASKITSAELVLLNDITGNNRASWVITENLTDGWNYIVLGADAATFYGAFDTDAINYVQYGVNATEDVTALIDRVRIINYAIEENRAVPAYEGVDRNPVVDKVIIDCNSTGGFIFTGNRVDKDDFRYGTGSVYTSGFGYQLYALGLDIGATDLIKKTFVMGLWVWIEDITLYDVDSFSSQIEIGSTNNFDEYEMYWDNWYEGLTNGWNWVVLQGKDANISGSAPDFDNLCRFRIYINGVDNSTLKIDRITISNIYDEGIFTAPDWENEVINKDSAFSGANGYIAENAPYLDIRPEDIAEGYVAIGPIELTGCFANMSTQLPVCMALVVIAAGILIKKRK